MAETDERESARVHPEELRPKNSMKRLAYVLIFAVFLTVIIILFSLTIMPVRDPKYWLSSIRVVAITLNSSMTTSPSFTMRFDVTVAVKNTNVGPFEFGNSTIYLAYKGGADVREAAIARAQQAGAKSTKRIEVVVDVSSNDVSSNSALAK